MLHELPIRNARLLACHEDWHRMTPTTRGRHCQSCQREVIDFTQASAAELAAARAAAPDGRVCGHFRRTQLAGGRPLRFGLWARAFALALALVFGQGLTAQKAWAQTRQAAPANAAARRPVAKPANPVKDIIQSPEQYTTLDGLLPEPRQPSSGRDLSASKTAEPSVYLTVEKMPEPPSGTADLQQYLTSRIRYPQKARQQQVEGKVFVSFTVAATGRLTDMEVVKGIGAGCDEEALRVLRQMPAWTPGQHNGRAVAVRYMLPIMFRTTEAPTTRRP